MKQKCCWVTRENPNVDCDSPATFEAWTRNDEGHAVQESDIHCCDAHLPWAIRAVAGDEGAAVYALPTPGGA